MKRIFTSSATAARTHLCAAAIKSLDFIILVLISTYFINDILSAFSSLIEILYNYFNFDYSSTCCCNMVDTVNSTGVTAPAHKTEVKIIHDDGSWSGAIRSLFIYGTGALRLHLARNGTPTTKAFVIGFTLATDALSKFINNTINDPSYVSAAAHRDNWLMMFKGSGEVEVKVDSDTYNKMNEAMTAVSDAGSSSAIAAVKKFIPYSSGWDDISSKIVMGIMNILRPILEPVTSDFSNEVLANQIHDLGILLFILSIFISILIVCLLINILVVLNSERFLSLFKNRYIRWYININIKLIGFEVFCLGSSILYFMYTLSKGIH